MLQILEVDIDTLLAKPSAEVLNIYCFKKIISRDRTNAGKKHLAIKELSYIYWVGVFDSHYFREDSQEKGIKKLIDDLKMPDDWVADTLVNEAIEYFKKTQKSKSMKLFEIGDSMVDSLYEYYNENGKGIDFKEEIESGSKKGELKYDITKSVKVFTEMETIINRYEELKKKVISELSAGTIKVRGDKGINSFEDED